MTDSREPLPTTIEDDFDSVALGRRAIAVVAADPLVHVGAGVLLIAGSLISFTLLAGPLLVGYIRLVDRALNGEPIDFVHLGLGFHKPAAAVLGWLVFVLSTAVLLVAFVLPGVFLIICWMFAFWFIALHNALASDALKAAFRLTQRSPGIVLLVGLAVVLVNSVGVLTIVGTLVTVPVSLTFMTLCFRTLTRVPS